MAIAFDAAITAQVISGANITLTYSHTCTGSDRILFVEIVTIQDVAGDPTVSVTYSGVAMTQVGGYSASTPGPGAQKASLWCLVGPATGGNNVVATASVAAFAILGASSSYTGAAQTGQPDSFTVGASTNTASYALATTVVAANCWLVIGTKNDGGAAGAGTGTTSRASSANGQAIMDSGGTVSTGSQTLTCTFGGAQNWVGTVASFKPVGASGGFFGRPYYDQIPQRILNV